MQAYKNNGICVLDSTRPRFELFLLFLGGNIFELVSVASTTSKHGCDLKIDCFYCIVPTRGTAGPVVSAPWSSKNVCPQFDSLFIVTRGSKETARLTAELPEKSYPTTFCTVKTLSDTTTPVQNP